MEKQFIHFATLTAKVAGKPWTFLLCLAVVIGWAVTGPIFDFSEAWQLVINTGTTIVTFLMVFLIQNTQNRDGAAIQAKLDELIHAVSKADERFVGIERLSERELDRILEEVEDRALRLRGAGPPVVATRLEDAVREQKAARKGAAIKRSGTKGSATTAAGRKARSAA